MISRRDSEAASRDVSTPQENVKYFCGICEMPSDLRDAHSRYISATITALRRAATLPPMTFI